MTLTREFCNTRAGEAADAAAGATLDNVRDRELRSEAAWRAMSDRILRTEEARAQRELGREQERELESEAAHETT